MGSGHVSGHVLCAERTLSRYSAVMELWNHPDIQPLVLQNVTLTGKTIGIGSYGSVEEVAIPGALCAAKRLHGFLIKEDLKWLAKSTAYSNIQKFVSECKIMNRLRHPHIVQFLGLWFEVKENSSLYLIMEKMMISLHDMLVSDKTSSNVSQPRIPFNFKCSILQDISQGLSYLHKHNPPLIHRDLSAKNVLLNSAMAAKISDLGMARTLPAKELETESTGSGATMTMAPGALVYMPPEALDNKSKYYTSIDMFSLGVIAIFLLAEMFPCDLKTPTFTDKVKGSLRARTELQRRDNYIVTIYRDLPRGHPLIRLIESCLENIPEIRPSIDRALELVQEAMADVKGNRYAHLNKLQLVQLLEKRDIDIKQQEKVLIIFIAWFQDLYDSLYKPNAPKTATYC